MKMVIGLVIVSGLVATALTACRSNGQPKLALPCTQPESLRQAPLLFSDAIYGQRGTNGGTVLELSPDSAGWTAMLEPVQSSFESEDRRWPEQPESLSISWTDAGHGRLLPKSGAYAPENRLSIDSAQLWIACDTARLVRWFGGASVDTIAMDRRRTRGWP
jgi:hypothetical protein